MLKLSVRPLRILFMEEDEAIAQEEIERLLGERERLENATPVALRDLGLDIELTGYFSMIDGKMANFHYKNRCSSTCPFCLTTGIIFQGLLKFLNILSFKKKSD